MNLFEKIFNYQVISRLDESGTFTLTSQERSWLKTMLGHPAAADAFPAETLEKLVTLLEQEETIEFSGLMEKAKSMEKQVYHPLLRTLRRILEKNQGIRITYCNKDGRINCDQSGFPYKLEYSMVKKEWYLLWYHRRHHLYMSTKLQNIESVHEESVPATLAEELTAKIEARLESRKEHAVIEVVRMYNRELSRILYAFSCFEKEVAYLDESDIYRIKVTYLGDEREYVLSKIRFLGKRVRVIEGEQLKQRMYESTAKALARYGVEQV
ncbi:WYL domain-containing protein [Brevibacillus migulae]|uniref:WYL domain-containing protein n=1 Tax=Brevibacillus migulae TaxID=1644114 RepID=UPI00106E236F|nr:WYL domain-containing protein [Brevibacillus migulae]